MEVSGALVQHIEKGNGICRSSSSLRCAVLGDICMPEVLEQTGDLALPNVKCKESRFAGSFKSAFDGFSDKQVNCKVDSVINDLKFEKPVRKKKNNIKRTYACKKISEKIVPMTGEIKYDGSDAKSSSGSDAKSSSPSIKDDIISPAMNCEKGSENNAPLVNSTSLCEKIQVKLCSEDPNIHNCNAKTCCKGPDKNKQGYEVCNSSHSIKETNGFKFHNLASELDALNKTRNHPHIMSGKENRHRVWQKGHRSVRETQISEPKRLQCNNVHEDASMLQKNLIDSSRHIGAAKGTTNAGNKETQTDVRIHQKVLVESSEWAARKRLNWRLDQHSQSSQEATRESDDCEEQKLKSSRSFKPQNYCRCKKGPKFQGHYFFSPHNKFCLCRKESLEVPFELNYYKNRYMEQRTYNSKHALTHGASCLYLSAHGQPTRAFTVPDQCELQPYGGVKIPEMNHISARYFHASADSVSHMTFKQYDDHQFRKDVDSGMNAKKWVPVGTKESSISGKTGSAGICHVSKVDLSYLREGENDGHAGGNIIDYHASSMLSKSKSTNLIGGHRNNIVEIKAPHDSQNVTTEVHHVESAEVRTEHAQNLKDIQQFIIGLQMVTDPLNSAYRMQLVSEGFEMVTGCPLAEFERFLYSAAPVIASSYLHAKCSVCSGNQLPNSSLCKRQIPNTSLFSVWKWYEEPGNYGLKVKSGDSQYLKGLLTKSTSCAHFVPYLSAVRLFGHSHISDSCGASEECCNPDMHIRNSSTAIEGHHFLAPVLKYCSIEKHVNSYKAFCSRGHSQSFTPSPDSSSNCEVVFEFFETEKPWLRKPLYNKIVDLIDAEASNLQGFGDPSKLKSLKLNDLHPASWFSVAWYPIYRIPEGKFGAAFLTYHSLGHLVLRDVPTDSLKKKTLSVVSPVVGLQSYKAQGECWFDLKIPVESTFKESSPFNRSEILWKQLKMLEENASLFSRGCVWTDDIKVFNPHQDYEFFSSHK